VVQRPTTGGDLPHAAVGLPHTYALGLPHTAEGCPILRGAAPWGGGLPHTAGSRYTWLCLDRTGLCSEYIHKVVFRLRTHTALRLGHGVLCFDCTGRCRAKSAPSQPELTQSPAESTPYLPKSQGLPNPPWFYALNLRTHLAPPPLNQNEGEPERVRIVLGGESEGVLEISGHRPWIYEQN